MAYLERSQTLENESLFSLELVVDSISLPKATCRFPSVAFRLLDFPTLVIYHVEPDLAENIKRKITSDPHYNVPSQLNELKDKNGNFIVKKGKSTLFKVSANILLNHLENTPLYMMLIDTYPEVPKLVGSCMVPLDNTMELLHEDITQMGLSVPAVHGEKGEYQVFNLMGSQVGSVVMGFRLLSLGKGLIQHIPDNAIAKVGQSIVRRSMDNVTSHAEKAKITADVILHDLETADKPVQVEISSGKPKTEFTQTDANIHRNVSATTQTQSRRRRKPKQNKEHLSIAVEEEDEEFFITNTVCPPPLYFNNDIEPKGLPTLELHEYAKHKPPLFGEENIVDSDISDDTIREEDRWSDSEAGDFYEYKTSKLGPQTLNVKRKVSRKTKPTFPWDRSEDDPRKVKQKATENSLASLSQMPLLNALITEIMTLKGITAKPEESKKDDIIISKEGLHHRKPSPQRDVASTPSSPLRKPETREEFMARLATPRKVTSTPSVTQVGQTISPIPAPSDTVPKNKGWLRKAPPIGVKKTKLWAGMTNTQRLRLAKTNPKLLKKLEEEEAARPKKKSTNAKMMDKTYAVASVDVSTEIRHHQVEATDLRIDLGHLKSDRSGVEFRATKQDQVSFSGLKDTMELRSPRKPKPTPRMSLHASQTRDDFEEMRKRYEQLQAEGESEYTNSESNSDKNIEVYVPSASFHSGDEGGDTDATSHHSDHFEDYKKTPRQTSFGKTRVLAGPGFPAESMESNDYSEDFDPESHRQGVLSMEGAEPGLKRVVDEYSDAESGQEPSLRKIVDQFSDESEETNPSQRSQSSHHSFHSAYSKVSQQSKRSDSSAKLKAAAATPPLPKMSDAPPAVTSKQPELKARQPFPSQVDHEDTNEEHKEDGPLSSGRPKSPRKQRPTIRKPQERKWSVHTESVSSYAPSDSSNVSELEDLSENEEYSDAFDELSAEIARPKQMSELRISKEAKMGYTWSAS